MIDPYFVHRSRPFSGCPDPEYLTFSRMFSGSISGWVPACEDPEGSDEQGVGVVREV
jgi:hypothetical protein